MPLIHAIVPNMDLLREQWIQMNEILPCSIKPFMSDLVLSSFDFLWSSDAFLEERMMDIQCFTKTIFVILLFIMGWWLRMMHCFPNPKTLSVLQIWTSI